MEGKRLSYLPDVWDNDVEMGGLMSLLKARYTNPTHYDRVVEFWKNMIAEYCRHESSSVFTLDELKMKFRRGSQIPSPLATVIAELEKSGEVTTREEYEKKNQGWLQWGLSFFNPTSWFGSQTNAMVSKPQLIHLPTLKEKAHELLDYYRNKYNVTMADCPEVIAFDDLRLEVSHFIKRDSFSLVISELVNLGEVSVGHSRDGERVLKFKDQTDTGPAKFTETDANVHEIRRTMNRLDLEIKKAEQKEQLLKDDALAAMRKKDKKAALNIMRKVSHIRKGLADKDVQYQRLLGMLEQLAQTKQTKEIIEVYKAGSKAFKETLARQGLTTENVDVTVDSVRELMDDYNDIEEALRDGFKCMSQNDTMDEADLESELNELLEGNTDKQLPKLPDVPTSTIRVGKRVLDLQSEFPEVPSKTPIAVGVGSSPSKHKVNGFNNSNSSLEERWKRLRMEVQ